MFTSPDPVVDFGGEVQIMDDDLTQRNGCVVAVSVSHVAAGIVEKWLMVVLLEHPVLRSGAKAYVGQIGRAHV